MASQPLKPGFDNDAVTGEAANVGCPSQFNRDDENRENRSTEFFHSVCMLLGVADVVLRQPLPPSWLVVAVGTCVRSKLHRVACLCHEALDREARSVSVGCSVGGRES